MPRGPATIPTIRSLAADLLREVGVSAPPLPIDLCLEARKLRLADEPLEQLLRGAGLRPATLAKPGAMLEARDRHVWVRTSLHTHQKKWAILHEIGHDVLPWQREMLFYCSLSDLAPTVRLEFEIEVNAFAAECLFLGTRFAEEAMSYPFGLATPKCLAERYNASYEATFRRYVEQQERACCLVVSRLVRERDALLTPLQPDRYETQYYVASPSFRGHVAPNQSYALPEAAQLWTPGGEVEIVSHEIRATGDGDSRAYYAQSFTNSYKLFTLLSAVPFDA